MKNPPDLEQLTIDYSLKNIPISNERAYRIKLFDMTNKFINRIRWKAYWYEKSLEEKEEDDQDQPEAIGSYKFPSRNYGPYNELLADFENDMFELNDKLKFRRWNNNLQRRMKKDITNIRKSDKIIAFSDKTNNLYKVDPSEYKKLLFKNITKDYIKCEDGVIDKINEEAVKIIQNERITGKIPKLTRNNAFLTIKDHKEQFPKNVKCRLINPCKTQMGKVSKSILDRINIIVRHKSKLIQWKNTEDVLKWYNQVKDKPSKCFVAFDIVDYYASITENEVLLALEFARQYTGISESEINLILHACKTVLTSNEGTWRKKVGKGLFDVPMGSFHGAELCDLVGLHLMSQLREALPFGMFGLYRDDGLSIVDIDTPSSLERLSKKIRSIMKSAGFNITIDAGSRVTNFLDVSLDLTHQTYQPYRKPNSITQYVHCESNHPPHILKGLPDMILKRISSLSINQETFDRTKDIYEAALQKSGYKKQDLNFQEPLTITPKTSKRNRRKKAIFFNAPFCASVKTNIGKEFFKIINKHFTQDHKYHNIFNRKTVKLSYSCMTNVKSIIQAHNRKIMEQDNVNVNVTSSVCNCRKKEECPLGGGNCRQENIIYKAVVSSELEVKEYIGSSGNSLKQRVASHKTSFNYAKYRNNTRLSSYIWNLKDKQKPFNIKWSIVEKIGKQNNGGKQMLCITCNLERLAIASADRKRALNKRSELTGNCPHKRSHFFPNSILHRTPFHKNFLQYFLYVLPPQTFTSRLPPLRCTVFSLYFIS